MIDRFDLPDFDEASMSQIPALLELVNLGYEYLSREAIHDLRDNNSQYILRDIAFDALRNINRSNISDKSIKDALYEAETDIDLGVGTLSASEDIYSLLVAGRSVSEIIKGRYVSPQLKFIDFTDPTQNQYHVCAEFELSEEHDRRPDIVLFVNGFPLAVIENKKASVKVDEAITQMIRNQGQHQTPKFFLFPQLLIATNVSKFKYGTMLTPSRYYTHWIEKDADENQFNKTVSAIINKAVPGETLQQIGQDLTRQRYVQIPDREVTEQDRGIYSLLRPERLLDLTRNFILYDNKVKKIARYPQYFGVKKAMQRLKHFEESGKRKGGLIWHTQGSGKSLSMVMLVKTLIDDPEIELPRIIVVTDRRDLDKQISDTFAACNIKKEVRRTRSAKELLKLIKDKDQRVLTTLIHKFEASRIHRDFVDDDPNVFILIDEAHRSQAGKANIELNLILPKASQIGFTGTPLMKGEKTSVRKFGKMIDAYTISEAESDGVILPLIYQPRFVEQKVKQKPLDLFYDRITKPLSDAQKKDLQQKFNSSQILEETGDRIEIIAMDISDHFQQYLETGLKAQVVAPSKYAAIRFKEAFDLLDDVPTAVIISDSSDKEDDDKLPEHKKVIVEWLQKEKHKWGSSLEKRERSLISDFKDNPEGVRILIVVDKLLTGFDAPRNTFLYLAKQLRDHNLLQAIARVNRLFEGEADREVKVNGFVIDYSKNARNLYDAMELFSKYDPEDVEKALLNSKEKIEELEKVYQELHGIFNAVQNKHDNEQLVRVLENDIETRERFYELVSAFIKQFATCQMLYDFTEKFDAEKLRRYQDDLKVFVELKKIQKIKHAETVDFSKYQDQIRRILDKYVTAEEVVELAKPLQISEPSEFNAFVYDTEKGLSDRSKAEAIAAQTERTIKENYHRDPEFYKRFSDKIRKLLAELKDARQEDLKALFGLAKDYQDRVNQYKADDIPQPIRDKKELHPFYRNVRSELKDGVLDQERLSEMVSSMYALIKKKMIVDWHRNIEVERQVQLDLEDYLFDEARDQFNLRLTPEKIDRITTMFWQLAVDNRE